MKKGFARKPKAIHLAIALMLVFMTACGSNGNDNASGSPSASAASDAPASASADAPASEAAADKPKVKLKFMHWWAYVDDKIIDEFEKQYPDIEVENMFVAPGDTYTNKLQALASTNELPDVFAPSDKLPFLVKQNQLLDLQEPLKTPAYDSDKTWMETQSKTLIQQLTDSWNNDAVNMPEDMKPKNGHFWALPFGAISVAMVYNKNIYDKVGIQAPKDYQEFLTNNDKLRSAGYIPIAFAGKIWLGWFQALFFDQTLRDYKNSDNPFLNGKFPSVDIPEVRDAFGALADMAKRKHFDEGMPAASIEDAQQLFVQQKAAQIFTVPENFVSYLVDNSPKDVKLGAFPLPGLKGLDSRSIGGAPNSISISAQTPNQEAAIRFAKFMTSNTVFQLLSSQRVVPSTEGYVPPADDAIMGAFAEGYAHGFADPLNIPFSPDNVAKLNNELAPSLIFNGDVDKFMKQFAELWDKDPANPKNK